MVTTLSWDIAWDELLYETLVGSSSTWSNALIHDELLNALQRIAAAPIQPTPFPHVRVNGLFSDRFYAALMAELPHHSAYTPDQDRGRVLEFQPHDKVLEIRDHGFTNPCPAGAGRARQRSNTTRGLPGYALYPQEEEPLLIR